MAFSNIFPNFAAETYHINIIRYEGRKRVWHLCAQNRDEQIDFDTKMHQLQTEMRDLLQQEEASNKELKSLFEKLGYSL